MFACEIVFFDTFSALRNWQGWLKFLIVDILYVQQVNWAMLSTFRK